MKTTNPYLIAAVGEVAGGIMPGRAPATDPPRLPSGRHGLMILGDVDQSPARIAEESRVDLARSDEAVNEAADIGDKIGAAIALAPIAIALARAAWRVVPKK